MWIMFQREGFTRILRVGVVGFLVLDFFVIGLKLKRILGTTEYNTK
jgi:hypothetical protein